MSYWLTILAYLGIAAIFALAKEYSTNPNHINNLTSKYVSCQHCKRCSDVLASWSIFLLGPGGIFAVMVMRRWGRLPVLFWTQVCAAWCQEGEGDLSQQVLALGFMVGCTFAPNLNTFAGLCLV